MCTQDKKELESMLTIPIHRYCKQLLVSLLSRVSGSLNFIIKKNTFTLVYKIHPWHYLICRDLLFV